MTGYSAANGRLRLPTEELESSHIHAVAPAVIRPSSLVDIGCAAGLPGHGAAGRRQLWTRHEGDHAVLSVHADEPVVRRWVANAHDAREGSDCRTLPLRRGFPHRAWHQDAVPDGGPRR